jgi:hypothetical protein
MWAGDDEFGLSTIEMRTPIRNNAVGAVRRVAFAPVADDRMIGSANGHLVHDEKRRIFRGKAENAVGKSLGAASEGGKLVPDQILDFTADRAGKNDHTHGEFTNSPNCHFAATMRRADEDDAMDLRVGVEDKSAVDEAVGSQVVQQLRRRFSRSPHPGGAIDGRDLHPRNESAKAMTYEHEGAMLPIGFLHFRQILAGGAVPNRRGDFLSDTRTPKTDTGRAPLGPH